jgi:hypothetical protein
VILESIHFDSLPFPRLTAAVASERFRGYETGMPVQPGSEHDLSGQLLRQPGQVHENNLCDILRKSLIALHQPERRGMNKIKVAPHQRPESRFRTIRYVIGEQYLAVRHIDFL